MDLELPTGYLKAWNKHIAPANDAHSLWLTMKIWRDLELGSLRPELKREDPVFYQQTFEPIARELVANFPDLILDAHIRGDHEFLATIARAPSLETSSVAAAVQAFWDLFVNAGLVSRDDWPTKKAVRERAQEVLRKAGRKILTKGQWTRVFKKAGLAALPHGDSTW
jgi:hypothetical protein